MKNKVTKDKTSAEIGMEKTRNAMLVRRRLSTAMLEEKKKLTEEGYEVPSTSLYVEGDTRISWKPEKFFNKSYKCYINEIKHNYGLTMTEIGIIHTLSFYIGYENNSLCKPNGDPLLKKDLSNIIELGENAVDKHMANLVAKGVFAKVKVKRSVNYYLDPRIAYQGNRIERILLSMFNISI